MNSNNIIKETSIEKQLIRIGIASFVTFVIYALSKAGPVTEGIAFTLIFVGLLYSINVK